MHRDGGAGVKGPGRWQLRVLPSEGAESMRIWLFQGIWCWRGAVEWAGSGMALDVPTRVSVLGRVWCQPFHGVGSPNLHLLALSGAAWAGTFGCPLFLRQDTLFPSQSDFNVCFNSSACVLLVSASGRVPSPGWGCQYPATSHVRAITALLVFICFIFPLCQDHLQPSPPLFSSPLSRVSYSSPAQVCGERG